MAKGSVTSFDKDITMEIKEDEELLWRGVPKKSSFVFSRSAQLLPIAIIWLFIDGFAISMIFRTNIPKSMMFFILIFFAFHLMPVWIWIHHILSATKKHKMIEYAFTTQRVIVRNGVILKSFYYKELNSVSFKAGFIDKLFKVGDIILTGQQSVVLLDIESPYAVSEKLHRFIDDFAEERSKLNAMRHKDCEYEEYVEHGEYSHVDRQFYDDSKYSSRRPYRNDFEEDNSAPKGRFTSKHMPANADKTEEDEYLDNIMGSINKKDEF